MSAPAEADPVRVSAEEDREPGPGPWAVLGGRLGVHASAYAGRWAALTALAMSAVALPLMTGTWLRHHCLQQGFDGQSPLWRACYSDLGIDYQVFGLNGGMRAFLRAGVVPDDPTLTNLVAALISSLAPHGGGLVGSQRNYLLAWALLTAVLAVAMVWLISASAGPARAWHLALSPVLITTMLISGDILGVALATAALWAWHRRHDRLTGVLLAYGILARTYPALILAVIVVWAWRRGEAERIRQVILGAMAALGAYLVVLLVLRPPGVSDVYRQWWQAPAGYGSLWKLPELATHPLPDRAVTGLAIAGIIAALAVGVRLIRRAPISLLAAHPVSGRRAELELLARIVLVVVAIALVTGKSVPVQASMWLIPLVALAGISWRDHLIWAGVEVTYFALVWTYIGGLSRPDRGLPAGWYAVVTILRIAAIGYLAYRAATAPAGRRSVTPVPSVPPEPVTVGVEDFPAGQAPGYS